MKKPIIAVDVDDVCANLIKEWLKRYNAQWNDNLQISDITDWSIHKFTKPECGNKMYHILGEPDLYDHVEAFPEALSAIQALRKMGRVIFVTSCAMNTMDRKFRWLQRKGFLPNNHEAVKDFVACTDKWLINADILIDDAVHNVNEFPNYALLVDRIHNQALSSFRPRITDLSYAPDAIEELFGHLLTKV